MKVKILENASEEWINKETNLLKDKGFEIVDVDVYHTENIKRLGNPNFMEKNIMIACIKYEGNDPVTFKHREFIFKWDGTHFYALGNFTITNHDLDRTFEVAGIDYAQKEKRIKLTGAVIIKEWKKKESRKNEKI
jgi:hypothetical protein